MSKVDNVYAEGIVEKALPNSLFRVRLDNMKNVIVLAHLSGKIRINSIKIMEGDRVRMAMSPYDLTRGRIVYLIRDKKQADIEQEYEND